MAIPQQPVTQLMTATLLLRVELVFLLVVATLFLAVPQTTIKALGLPEANAFWPRLVGAVFLALAAATIAQDQGWTKNGLGLGGFVAINLTLAVTLALVAPGAAPTRRGRAFLWLMAAICAALGFVQIAYIS